TASGQQSRKAGAKDRARNRRVVERSVDLRPRTAVLRVSRGVSNRRGVKDRARYIRRLVSCAGGRNALRSVHYRRISNGQRFREGFEGGRVHLRESSPLSDRRGAK